MTEQSRPLLRVVSGSPSDEELAALTAVVAALSQQGPASPSGTGGRLGVLRRRPPPAAAPRCRWLARVGTVRVSRRLVLGSASPARLQLMRQAGWPPRSWCPGSTRPRSVARVSELVALLATAKAQAVARSETDAW